MVAPFPTGREDLEQLELIAEASSFRPGKEAWTELGLYYRAGADRPFVAVIIGAGAPDHPLGKNPSFRSMASGTLPAAMARFDPTLLFHQLQRVVPRDAEQRWPEASVRRQAEKAANMGYSGPADVAALMLWLYGDDVTVIDACRQMEADFGDEIVRCLQSKAFYRAMRCFDRAAFLNLKEQGTW